MGQQDMDESKHKASRSICSPAFLFSCTRNVLHSLKRSRMRSFLVLFVIILLGLLYPLLSVHTAPTQEVETVSGLPADLPDITAASSSSTASSGGLFASLFSSRQQESDLSADNVLLGEGEEGAEEGTVEGGMSGRKKGKAKKGRPPPPPSGGKRSIIEVDEAEACVVPRPLKPCRLGRGERVNIIFVSAMWYREEFTKTETETMLKSLLFQTQCRIHIHFMVAGEPEVSTIRKMMRRLKASELIPTPSPYTVVGKPYPSAAAVRKLPGYQNASSGREDILFSLHFIPTQWVEERAKALHLFPLAHHAGVPGMSKFFMPEILWQVQRAVYLDVDMIFAGDVQDMWDYFKVMDRNPRLMFYMSNNHPEGHNRRRWLRPLCSCQMVLDLTRLREANLTQLFISTLNGHRPKDLKEYVEDGDQFLFMRTCKLVEGVCRVLPRMWNVSGCSKPVPFLGLTARGKEKNGTCWRVVHFNCMGHRNKRSGRYNIPHGWGEAFQFTRGVRLENTRDPQRSF